MALIIKSKQFFFFKIKTVYLAVKFDLMANYCGVYAMLYLWVFYSSLTSRYFCLK